jgi:hypothetical protein
MKRSELKYIIKECIKELSEEIAYHSVTMMTQPDDNSFRLEVKIKNEGEWKLVEEYATFEESNIEMTKHRGADNEDSFRIVGGNTQKIYQESPAMTIVTELKKYIKENVYHAIEMRLDADEDYKIDCYDTKNEKWFEVDNTPSYEEAEERARKIKKSRNCPTRIRDYKNV